MKYSIIIERNNHHEVKNSVLKNLLVKSHNDPKTNVQADAAPHFAWSWFV